MKHNIVLILTSISIVSFEIQARSPHRPIDPQIPEISISWKNSTAAPLTYRNAHFEKYPLFSFDHEHFQNNLLPSSPISFRQDSSHHVDGAHLSKLIENLVEEIKQKKSSFSHFTILQSKNFSRNNLCGLMVLKFNDYPFVLKLFLETPETFMTPHCKGVEPIAFFYMAGGANRHITGFTRIKNRNYLSEVINQSIRWKNNIEFPRKWFWLPSRPTFISITGKNMGEPKSLSTEIPAIYGIIADAMEVKDTAALTSKDKKQIIMNFCNDIDLFIDPHQANFSFQQTNSELGWKIIIVDTEHFPTMCGIKKRKKFRNHNSYYMYLVHKCFNNTWLCTKDMRLSAQYAPRELDLNHR